MATRDAPMGFRPAFHHTGGTIRVSQVPYQIIDGYGTGIGMGDPVIAVSTGGTIGPAINIGVAASGGAQLGFLGVFNGCSFQNLAGEMTYSKHWTASQALKTGTLARAYVYDDPEIVYRIQASGAIVTGDIWDQADMNDTAFDTTTGISRREVNSSAIGNPNLQILGLVEDGANELGTNTELLVMFNESAWRNDGAGSIQNLA